MSNNQNAKDLFEDINTNADLKMVAMKMGVPGPTTMKGCSELLLAATTETLEDESREESIFEYGTGAGDCEFRVELAKFLSAQYGDKIDSDSLMVTSGATQGLHLVATVLFDINTPVFVVDPTYFNAITMLRQDFRMNIIPVATDDDGIIVEEFEKLLEEHYPVDKEINRKSPFWAMVYLVPTYSNPKGYCLPPERCQKLIQLARKFDVLLLAEDVYNMMTYSDTLPPPRLLHYDNRSDPDYKGNTLSNCTFSKILAPGLRLGWIEAPERIHNLLTNCHTAWGAGCFNQYMSKVITVVLKKGLLSKHLIKIRKQYKVIEKLSSDIRMPDLGHRCQKRQERMELMCKLLKEKMPSSVNFRVPKGGFFVWLELPKSVDTEKLYSLCSEKYKINFLSGVSSSPTKSFRNCLRLSISYYTKEELSVGVKRLAKAVTEMLTINYPELE